MVACLQAHHTPPPPPPTRFFLLPPTIAFSSALACVWDWTAQNILRPAFQVVLEGLTASLEHINCHPSDPQLIVATGPRDIVLLQWSFGGDLQAQALGSPGLSTLTQSVFLPDTERIATGTMQGDLVTWALNSEGGA